MLTSSSSAMSCKRFFWSTVTVNVILAAFFPSCPIVHHNPRHLSAESSIRWILPTTKRRLGGR